jgi:hypothetical protein
MQSTTPRQVIRRLFRSDEREHVARLPEQLEVGMVDVMSQAAWVAYFLPQPYDPLTRLQPQSLANIRRTAHLGTNPGGRPACSAPWPCTGSISTSPLLTGGGHRPESGLG